MKLIKASSDRKTRFYNSQKNTFGLLPGLEGTCPGCTTAAGGCWFKAPGRKTSTCYVDNVLRIYKGVRSVLAHNTVVLREAAASSRPLLDMKEILEAEFIRFKESEKKHAAKTGDTPHLFYRLHWSGDVFSLEYAEALRLAMSNHPDIQFWDYTRSFFAVPTLVQTPNLILYLSLDPVNALNGLVVYHDCNGPDNPRLQLCYMSDENNFETIRERALEILEARNQVRVLLGGKARDTKWLETLKLRECPVDTGKMSLESGCPTCRRCLTPGTGPVWFAS